MGSEPSIAQFVLTRDASCCARGLDKALFAKLVAGEWITRHQSLLICGPTGTTAAGFVLASLGRLPAVGESFEAFGWRFEVVDLDGRRVDKILAKRIGRRRAALRN